MRFSLKAHLQNFISSRTQEIGNHIISANAEYRELSDRSIALYHSVCEHLPAEAHSLLDEYENAVNLMRALAYDAMYEQGLKDGIKLQRLLRRG